MVQIPDRATADETGFRNTTADDFQQDIYDPWRKTKTISWRRRIIVFFPPTKDKYFAGDHWLGRIRNFATSASGGAGNLEIRWMDQFSPGYASSA
ncbi:MAG: hypothetical protein HZA50_03270 [Planctomycetes bacterium]|nr:hypothetical protein [Planctomycetota bacterium]